MKKKEKRSGKDRQYQRPQAKGGHKPLAQWLA